MSMEEKTLHCYIKTYQKKVLQVGVVLHKLFLLLCASPDGIIAKDNRYCQVINKILIAF